MKGERGFALVITLVVTALLVALTVQFVDDVFVETSSAQNFIDGQQAGLMANSGVDGAIQLLRISLSGRSYTTLSDMWATPLQIEDEKGSLRVTIEDEAARVNLNRIARDLGKAEDSFYFQAAARLFKRSDIPLDLLDALADWQDLNDEPLPGGAETAHYMKMKQPYKAKNGKLATVEELALIRGFDMTSLQRIKRYVRVYPVAELDERNKININTAPREVLASLADDMTDAIAREITDYRITTPFKSTGELANVPGVESVASRLQLYTSVTSTLYRITSEARVGETVRTVEAVVDTQSTQPFLYWREY